MPRSFASPKSLAGRILGFALLFASAAAAGADSLIADPRFDHGFRLTGASHKQIELDAPLSPPGVDDASPPPWRIAQWGSRDLLLPGNFEVDGDGAWRAENAVKAVTIRRGGEGGEVTLGLAVDAATEYGGELRQHGQPWPHLLIDQRFAEPIRIADHAAMPFALSFRVPRCETAEWADGRLDPTLHTAHVTAFFTVHIQRNGAIQPGEMIWFGIPLFDARHPIPPGHQAIDAGAPDASGKFICTLEGARFWDSPTGDGEWHALSVDLKPLLAEALEISQEHGHLEGAAPEDLVLTSFNLGWEVPGPYDAVIEIRGLSFKGN